MNYGIVIKTLGKILVLEAVMMIFPSAVSLCITSMIKWHLPLP